MVTRRAGRLQWIGAMFVAVLPWFIKRAIYRHAFGYKIGRNVKIGLSPFVGVRSCTIGDGVRIGHLNLFLGTTSLEIGAHVEIGFLNLFRGGNRITLGEYATILRRNVFNSIPDAEVVNAADPAFIMGAGSVLTSSHWMDFTDRVVLGANCIVGGRASSFWTHNRQRTRPIEIGAHTYLGSEVRLAPGASVASCCIVALGSVLMERFTEPLVLIGGNPAKVFRALSERDLFLITRKTRADIPEEIATRFIPADVRARVAGSKTERQSAEESLFDEVLVEEIR